MGGFHASVFPSYCEGASSTPLIVFYFVLNLIFDVVSQIQTCCKKQKLFFLWWGEVLAL